jgi:hypothetical protein
MAGSVVPKVPIVTGAQIRGARSVVTPFATAGRRPAERAIPCLRSDILNLLNMSTITEAQSTFIEDMGQMMVGWGIARTTGRIYAYLLLRKESATLDDLEAMTSARTQQMHQLVARLRQGARAASGSQSRQRLVVMADWCDALINEFPLLIRRLDKRRTR